MFGISLIDGQRANRATLAAVFAALLALLFGVAMFYGGGGGGDYHKLKLAYKLTQKEAVSLSVGQMRGDVSLMREQQSFADEDEEGGTRAKKFVSITTDDLLRNMKRDVAKHDLDGICAMNYNIPVSMCYMPRLGAERDLVLYNLRMIGFSNDTHVARQYDFFCDHGGTEYGHDRFDEVWFEWYNTRGKLVWMCVSQHYAIVMQSLAWLNQGVLVCDRWSKQRQADAIFDMINYRRVKP